MASARLTVLVSVARKTKSFPARSRTRTSFPANAARRKLGNLRVNSRVVTCMTDIHVSHRLQVKEFTGKFAGSNLYDRHPCQSSAPSQGMPLESELSFQHSKPAHCLRLFHGRGLD